MNATFRTMNPRGESVYTVTNGTYIAPLAAPAGRLEAFFVWADGTRSVRIGSHVCAVDVAHFTNNELKVINKMIDALVQSATYTRSI